MLAIRHTQRLALRHLRALWRQPAYVFITLAQPIIWLLLFSQLFGTVTHIPGFTGGPYIDYLAPGVGDTDGAHVGRLDRHGLRRRHGTRSDE